MVGAFRLRAPEVAAARSGLLLQRRADEIQMVGSWKVVRVGGGAESRKRTQLARTQALIPSPLALTEGQISLAQGTELRAAERMQEDAGKVAVRACLLLRQVDPVWSSLDGANEATRLRRGNGPRL